MEQEEKFMQEVPEQQILIPSLNQMNQMRSTHGDFTGIKFVDSLILIYLDGEDLWSLLSVNKYFFQFRTFEPIWKKKILFTFGENFVVKYYERSWFDYYYCLSKIHQLCFNPKYYTGLKFRKEKMIN
jgi:hypothetical protein